MSERTTEEIAEIFTHAGDSVTVINTLAALSSLTDEQKDKMKRNIEHLEIIKAFKKEDGIIYEVMPKNPQKNGKI